MSKEAQSYELTYDLIKRAVHGEPAAIEKFLLHYDAYFWHGGLFYDTKND